MPRKKKACPYCGKIHPVWWSGAKHRDGWYLTIPDSTKANGQRQICLARGWESHDDALRQWHLMEADAQPPGPPPNGEFDGERMRVGELVNLLLENLEPKLSSKRFSNAKSYLSNFAQHFGSDTVSQMRIGGASRVENWIAKNKGWRSPSTRRTVISHVKHVFNFGVEQGYIASTPIKALSRPKDVVRVSLFTAEQEEAILAEADRYFAAMFKFLLLTGCRPGEACGATDGDIRSNGSDKDLHLLVAHKNMRHTGEKRRIYLLFAEVKKMIRDSCIESEGALFRTKSGRPWSNATLNKEFRKITATDRCAKLGLDRRVVKERTDKKQVRRFEYLPYTCRHTFAFRLLTGFYKDADGRPVKKNYGEVAIYMGDSAKMIEDVYGKLARATEMLGEEIG